MKKFKGLTSAEVQASKNAHGDNRLSSKEANSLLSIFIEAFQDQWILILLAALGLKNHLQLCWNDFPCYW